jgi:hypothetical protein
MTHITEVISDVTKLTISFTDEGVELEATTHVKGGEQEALRYLPVFEADIRRNFADHFPAPETPEGGMV